MNCVILRVNNLTLEPTGVLYKTYNDNYTFISRNKTNLIFDTSEQACNFINNNYDKFKSKLGEFETVIACYEDYTGMDDD